MDRKNVWIYCRVVYPANMALAMQKENLTRYAETNGMEVCGITAEIAGGTTLSRTGFNEVNQKIKSGKSAVLWLKIYLVWDGICFKLGGTWNGSIVMV